MNSYIQTLRNLGAARLGIIALVTLGVIGFFIYLSTRLTTGDMALLYNDLARSDSGAIVKKLDALHVPYQVNPEGTNIMVPADQVGKVRMELAQDGLPAGGSIGYEIFDQQPAFGTTSFMQNMNQLRALEGELSRTVGALGSVRQARIHLVMPRRELFSRDESPASASVLLQLRPGAQLGREQISAIRHLVAAAVPQLKADAVSIVDDKGNLLAKPSEGDTETDLAQSEEERRRALEARMSRTVEDLVGRTVGFGKVRATVTADMDFDRVTTNTDSYDPDGQVVRSTQTVQENNNSEDAEKTSAVTVSANLPGGQPPPAGGGSSKVQGSRQEETVNYEITHKTESHVREAGQIKHLSVAVIVDGTYTPGADGKDAYHPRSQEELQQITQLIKSAVGFQTDRGDTVSVANLQFAQDMADGIAPPETSLLGFGKHDLMHLAEVALIAVVAVLILLLVVRPLMSRLLASAQFEPRDSSSGQPLLTTQVGSTPQLAGPSSALAQAFADGGGGEDESGESMIDISQVEGRVRASSMRKIAEIVEKHPTEAVTILRGSIYQET